MKRPPQCSLVLAVAAVAVVASTAGAAGASAGAFATGASSDASSGTSEASRTSAPLGELAMVAVRPDGAPVTGDADQPSISANGRYVTYTSKTLAVVGLANNGATQVFRYDRRTGSTVLVSATPDGAPGEEDSDGSTISADGSVVAFQTESGDLLPDAPDLHFTTVIVARDLSTGHTSLVSQTSAGSPPNAGSFDPLVTADGQLVGFRTYATDITGVAGAVVFDRSAGASDSVIVDTRKDPYTVQEAFLSGDGAWLAFATTNAAIVPHDDNRAADAFLLNRATGDVTLVSRAADGTVADAQSRFIVNLDSQASPKPFTSADGSRVVFLSDATDLAGAADPSGGAYTQAYAFDVPSGMSELASALPDGSPSDSFLDAATISPDGRYISVTTEAFLTGGAGPLGPKVFVRDLRRDTTRAASDNEHAVGAGLGGRKPHSVFTTFSPLLPGDTDGDFDVYRRRMW